MTAAFLTPAFATAIPASALPDHPDAELLRLDAEYQAFRAAIKASDERAAAIRIAASAKWPPLPKVLKYRPGDSEEHALPKPRGWEHEGYHTTLDRNELASHRPTRRVALPIREYDRSFFGSDERVGIFSIEEEAFIRSEPSPEVNARQDELVAALDRWAAECDEIDRAYGVEPEEKREEDLVALCDREDDILEQILTVPARTLDGLAVKARAIRHKCDDGAIANDASTESELVISVVNTLIDWNAKKAA